MLEKIKEYMTSAFGFYTLLFAILSLFAWYSNGELGKKYDIKTLTEIYTFIMGQLTIKYGIDSGLNSQKGEKPK